MPDVKIIVRFGHTAQCFTENKFELIDNSSITGGSLSGGYWKFSDGDTATGNNVSKSFSSVGNYLATLVHTSDKGCVDSVSQNLQVIYSATGSFKVNDSLQCLNENLFEFTNTSVVSDIHRLWTFGDGSSDTSKNPQKTYKNAGSYTVHLINAFENGCADTTQMSIVVNPNPNTLPIVGDSFATNSLSPFRYITYSQLNHSFFWQVSGGEIVSGQNTRIIDVHWTDTGWATVRYVLTNSFGCTDTASLQVHVSDTSTFGIYDLEGVSLKLYPNPVRDLLYLQVDKPVKIVKVFDSKGVLVIEENKNTEVIDFSKLSSGVYMVYVQDTDGHFIIGKVVKE